MPLIVEGGVARVKADHMKTFTTVDVKYSDMVPYIKLIKSSRKIETLFGITQHVGRPLADTNIIENIAELRDKKIIEMWGEVESRKIDIGVNETETTIIDYSKLPQTTIVRTAPYMDVEGIDIRVLVGRPKEPVHVQLCEVVINYIVKIVAKQIEAGDIVTPHKKRKAEKFARAESGVKKHEGEEEHECATPAVRPSLFDMLRVQSCTNNDMCNVVEDED